MYQFLGVDLGTSAVKCIIIDEVGNTLAKARKTYPRIFRKPGYIEQDPKEWWTATKEAIKECLQSLSDKNIAAISLSGHMSAPVLLNKQKQVVANAILIADTRSQQVTKMLHDTMGDRFLSATGNLPLDAFTVSKLLWIKNNQPDIYRLIDKVIFPKDYIRLMLTGEVATDHTDAGNSLLYHFHQRDWNYKLIEEVGLPAKWFPRIEESTDISGYVIEEVAKELGFASNIPVICGAADIACSQIGSGALSEDVIALTLSTSIQVVTPSVVADQGTSMNTRCCCSLNQEGSPIEQTQLKNKITYHPSAQSGKQYIMASIFSGGMSIEWLYKLFHKESLTTNEQYERLLQNLQERYRQAPLNDVIFLPFLTGSGSPWFNTNDRGGFYGLTPDLQQEDFMLAVLEGIGYNVKDNIDLITAATNNEKQIYLAGGGSMMTVWTKILASILDQPIQVLKQKDVSSLGAVTIAGVGVGVFHDFKEGFRVCNEIERVVEPQPNFGAHYQSKYELYQCLHNSIREYNHLMTDRPK